MPYKNPDDRRRANKAAYEQRRRELNNRTCARCGVVHAGRYAICKDCRAVLNPGERKTWENAA